MNKDDEQRKRTFNGLIAKEWTLLSRNVWNDVSSPRKKKHIEHGATFPEKLVSRLIQMYSKEGDLIASNSSGDLLKINSKNGDIFWSINTLESLLPHDSDFFKSSDIVIINQNIIFSTQSAIFSYNLDNGGTNWRTDVSSIATPIVDGKNIFFVTENGYFVIIDIDSGKIISSTNILKILKRKKQSTKITGFIMGSGKVYSVTSNGYLVVSSAYSGKVEKFKKIGNSITSTPTISNGKLFLYTEDSKIIGFN